MEGKNEANSLKAGARKGILYLHSANIVLEILSGAERQKEKLKDIQTGKEVKLPPFADDMPLYM